MHHRFPVLSPVQIVVTRFRYWHGIAAHSSAEDLVGGRWPMSSQEYSSSRLSGREHTSSPAPINCRQQQQAAHQAQQSRLRTAACNVRQLEQEEVQQQAQQQAQLRGLQQQAVYQARQQQAQREAQQQRAVYGVWLDLLQNRRHHSKPLPRRTPAAAATAASTATAPTTASVAALDGPSDAGLRTPDAGRQRQTPTQHLRRKSSHHPAPPQSLPAAQPDREASIRIGLLATALTEHTTCTDSWHTNWMLATALTDPDVGRSLSSLCTGSSEHTQQRVRTREHRTSERVPLGHLWV